MNKRSLDFFKQLLNHIGPSGYEQTVSRFFAQEVKTFADEVVSDQHGNVMACINKGGSPRVMLAGHIDEIGLMITHVDDKGFLDVDQIGGWDPQILQGQRVWIETRKGRIPGVIGKKPIHKIKPAERDKVIKLEKLFIDIGASSKKEAEKRVAVGDPVVIAYEPQDFPNNLLASRALDDRAGVFTILEAGRLLSKMKPKAEVHVVATVQEEVGLRGVTTSCYAIAPDVGFAVDVTFATDFPSMDKKGGSVDLGKGPAVSRGPNLNPVLFDLVMSTAKKCKIPVQVEPAPHGTGTDANKMQLTRAGVATALISIPCRYVHTPCELVSLKDIEHGARLIAETVMRIEKDTDFTLGL
ncbi:MAG: M42 family metallopeptidase [Kiritimatiellae bacterium]|nr:M42 family metallopeptidase [Kiritimatiellia bacterium]MDD4737373.1 M42 family metallopeptidase [Kiritimatiellia bacterium]